MLNITEDDALAATNIYQIMATADTFEGMMSPLSVAVWTALIRLQTSAGVKGDFIEFGVYRGKSASVIANTAERDDTIHLVDIADYPEKNKLKPLHDRLSFYKARSEELVASGEADAFRNIRFSHHDASHYFKNVEAEVSFIAERLVPGAIVVLDDFGFVYSQVMAGFFYLKYVKGLPLEIFLISANKAYVCHQDDFAMYERYMCDGVLDDLKALGFNCQIARTDNDPRHRAFYIDSKKAADAPDRYGLNVWGDRFYRPSA